MTSGVDFNKKDFVANIVQEFAVGKIANWIFERENKSVHVYVNSKCRDKSKQ